MIEIKCLRSTCGVRRNNRVKSGLIRKRRENKLSLLERADRRRLRRLAY